MNVEGNAGSYEVRPGDVEALADELAAQREAVRLPADRIAALGAHPLELGAFAEAYALRDAHAAAVQRMGQLTYAVAVAIGFAEEVARAVAAGYAEADEAAAQAYRSLANRAAGTVYTSRRGGLE
ncbi:hypothetical protein [Mangrovihabitans endophyticus]|uniref:Uncharacterized protein n=1 Tax=Mangrovihabitans endophyticus TaxID=1751298 RepID=A0A8J3BVU4_9ACTN|nr:hypothetical protein [Mangrovihabitans endophyticus]GGK77523.1 hypothetical protein GCM10012284_09420 [Mangrovihabitans endophyticus]